MLQIDITSHTSVFIQLKIQWDFQLPRLPSTFVSLAQKHVPYSISNCIWNTSKLLLLSVDVEVNPGPRPIDQNSVFCFICSNKINWGIQQDKAYLLALTETVMHDAIKPAMVYLSTKTAMRKLPVALSPGNVLPTNSSPSQSLPVTSQNKLKIYQWNADGIRPKLLEVRDWQINSDIDVLTVHESKLRKTDKTPFIVGYATIRKVRNNILGGDLLLFIRTDIVFEKLHSLKKAGMETLSIRLKATKSTCLNSTIYIYQTPQLNIIHSTPF